MPFALSQNVTLLYFVGCPQRSRGTFAIGTRLLLAQQSPYAAVYIRSVQVTSFKHCCLTFLEWITGTRQPCRYLSDTVPHREVLYRVYVIRVGSTESITAVLYCSVSPCEFSRVRRMTFRRIGPPTKCSRSLWGLSNVLARARRVIVSPLCKGYSIGHKQPYS
jgi:hypothetical protein